MTLHAEDRDLSVDPGTDFYRFANGGWIDKHPIPAGFGAWGSFEEVLTRNELVLRRELERAGTAPADDLERRLGELEQRGPAVVGVGGPRDEPLVLEVAQRQGHLHAQLAGLLAAGEVGTARLGGDRESRRHM